MAGAEIELSLLGAFATASFICLTVVLKGIYVEGKNE